MLAANVALASETVEICTDWKASIGAGGTAFDAARQIFRSATLDQDNRLVLEQDKVLRMPGTSKNRAELPAGTTLSGIWFSFTVRSQGKNYTVVLWNGERPESTDQGGWGEGVAVLAVFPEGSIEPTDVAEVKQDHSTSPGERLVRLGDEDAFEILNGHTNAGQGYRLTDLFHLHNGRLRRIASGIFTLTANAGCSQGSFDETLRWFTDGDGANPPRIVATVELVHAPRDFVDDCQPALRTWSETFQATYRWDTAKGRYLEAGGTLDRLLQWNENHQ
ncbi:MAG: hypothetical protein BWK76_10570 [Desulfobulbaceae bacterium A2]|nr:MAG: hypothetical protein BWK76_10570 [Desulfobulbaceae bacterium A2]